MSTDTTPPATRSATGRRSTKETGIEVDLVLDGTGTTEVSTGLPFLDHMVSQLGRHGGFDLRVVAEGDLEVDAHHTVEDVGITLGETLARALGDKAGIRRFASIALPLDEALVEVALDLSGRPFLAYGIEFATGDDPTRLSALRPPAGGGILESLLDEWESHSPLEVDIWEEHSPYT